MPGGDRYDIPDYIPGEILAELEPTAREEVTKRHRTWRRRLRPRWRPTAGPMVAALFLIAAIAVVAWLGGLGSATASFVVASISTVVAVVGAGWAAWRRWRSEAEGDRSADEPTR